MILISSSNRIDVVCSVFLVITTSNKAGLISLDFTVFVFLDFEYLLGYDDQRPCLNILSGDELESPIG